MKFVYEKEGIMISVDDVKAEFIVYQHLKTVEDDSEVFPPIARIPDAMLRKVDPPDSVLIGYLQTINPSIKIGVLLANGIVGPSKRAKGSKKVTQASPSKPDPSLKKIVKPVSVPTSKEVNKPITEETCQPAKETMPSKSGVLKQLKKMEHRPCHSLERSIVIEDSKSGVLSHKGVSRSKRIRKH